LVSGAERSRRDAGREWQPHEWQPREWQPREEDDLPQMEGPRGAVWLLARRIECRRSAVGPRYFFEAAPPPLASLHEIMDNILSYGDVVVLDGTCATLSGMAPRRAGC
jgi:hypothetical protein